MPPTTPCSSGPAAAYQPNPQASTALVPWADSDTIILNDLGWMLPQPGEILVWIPDLWGDERDRAFPAQVQPWRWNGFAVPSFRREVAVAVVAATNQIHRYAPLDNDRCWWEDDEVVMHSPIYAADDEDYVDDRIAPNRDGRYSIGGCYWTWQVVPDDEPFPIIGGRE